MKTIVFVPTSPQEKDLFVQECSPTQHYQWSVENQHYRMAIEPQDLDGMTEEDFIKIELASVRETIAKHNMDAVVCVINLLDPMPYESFRTISTKYVQFAKARRKSMAFAREHGVEQYVLAFPSGCAVCAPPNVAPTEIRSATNAYIALAVEPTLFTHEQALDLADVIVDGNGSRPNVTLLPQYQAERCIDIRTILDSFSK